MPNPRLPAIHSQWPAHQQHTIAHTPHMLYECNVPFEINTMQTIERGNKKLLGTFLCSYLRGRGGMSALPVFGGIMYRKSRTSINFSMNVAILVKR